jgi:hypothetical protein
MRKWGIRIRRNDRVCTTRLAQHTQGEVSIYLLPAYTKLSFAEFLEALEEDLVVYAFVIRKMAVKHDTSVHYLHQQGKA